MKENDKLFKHCFLNLSNAKISVLKSKRKGRMEYLSRKQIAEWLGISISSVDKLPVKKIKISTHVVRYLKQDIVDYLETFRLYCFYELYQALH